MGVGDAFAAGVGGQVGDACGDGVCGAGDGGIEVGVFQQEAVLLRVGEYGLGGEETEHVAGGFFDEPEVDGALDALFLELLGDAPLSGVVRGGHAEPASILGVGFAQVGAGGAGAFFDVVAFVDVVVHLQSVVASGAFHELPHAGGSGPGACQGVETAFDDGQVLQVVGQAFFAQDGLDEGEVTVGALEGEHGGGVHVGEGHQFAVHPFAQVVAVEGDGFVGKAYALRHRGRGGERGDFRTDGVALGVEGGVAYQQRQADACAQGGAGGEEGEFQRSFHCLYLYMVFTLCLSRGRKGLMCLLDALWRGWRKVYYLLGKGILPFGQRYITFLATLRRLSGHSLVLYGFFP